MHYAVVKLGANNFRKARIPLVTDLKISAFRTYLVDYIDKDVINFLEFGWPINYQAQERPKGHDANHRSAYAFTDVVDKDIQQDIKDGALLGPFNSNPLAQQLTLSPLQTVPNKGQGNRRVVVDMSYPTGASVNDGIPTDTYMGCPYQLKYPTVDTLARMVRDKGRGCLMFKRDLKRAYKQLPLCPYDWSFCGIKWRDNVYIYVSQIFGLRSSAMACQRTTNCVTYIYNSAGYDCCNYLDDFGGCDFPCRAQLAFETLGFLLQALGLKENIQKAVEPSTLMVFLGILFNSEDMTLTIPEEKLFQTRMLLREWLCRVSCTFKELQSLLGTLQHVSSCVRPGRAFINRMLNEMRAAESESVIYLSYEFIQDVKWWCYFMEDFNGVSIMPENYWSEEMFSSDACDSAAGGYYDGSYFHVLFPARVLSLPIHVKEMFAMLTAVKLWGSQWAGKKIVSRCDNMACVQLINSGRSRDYWMQACIRELWYLASKFSFEIRAVHIAGSTNTLADHLSRWYTDSSHQARFNELTHNVPTKEFCVSPTVFNFTHVW